MTRPATETTTRLGLRSIVIGSSGPGSLTALSGVPASWWICWADAAADRDMPSEDIGFDREPEAR
jgi:hypothetical protein